MKARALRNIRTWGSSKNWILELSQFSRVGSEGPFFFPISYICFWCLPPDLNIYSASCTIFHWLLSCADRCIISEKQLVKHSLTGHGHRARSLTGRGLYPKRCYSHHRGLWAQAGCGHPSCYLLGLCLCDPQLPLLPHVGNNPLYLMGCWEQQKR